MTKEEQELYVAFKGIINYQGKILVLQESSEYQEGTNKGKWDFPGGRLKKSDKDIEAGGLREIKEETGLDVKVRELIGINEWYPIIQGKPSHIIGLFYECQSENAEIKLSEDHSSHKLIFPEEYREINLIETNIPPLEKYMQKLKARKRLENLLKK